MKTLEELEHEGCAEEIPDVDDGWRGDGRELVVRRLNVERVEERLLYERNLVGKKRQAGSREGEDVEEPGGKRVKSEEEVVVAKAPRKSSKKRGKERRERNRKRCCKHCKGGV